MPNFVVKTICIIICICLVSFIIVKPVRAATIDIDNLIGTADNFISEGESNYKADDSAIKGVSDTLYNILLGIGIIIDVIVGIIIGIKFMLASSSEEQAKVQESLIPYLIGSAILFGAFGIWKLVVTILTGI